MLFYYARTLKVQFNKEFYALDLIQLCSSTTLSYIISICVSKQLGSSVSQSDKHIHNIPHKNNIAETRLLINKSTVEIKISDITLKRLFMPYKVHVQTVRVANSKKKCHIK